MEINQADILYEDNHLLALNKKPGTLSQGDITGDESLVDQVKAFLKDKYRKTGNVFAGLAHRLDRPVSGIILFAKTSKALDRLNRIFRERQVKKTYLAIVASPVATEGLLLHWMVKDQKTNKATVYPDGAKGGKKAELSYRILAHVGKEYLLEVTPHTGRPHQIRAQLAFIGAPIKGDLKYGYPKPNSDKSICLHAFRLTFIHPVQNEELSIAAPLPSSPDWINFRQISLWQDKPPEY